MTGRKLYDKYVDALKDSERDRWVSPVNGERHWVRTYPVELPTAWPFLSDAQKATWNALAKSLNPRRRGA